METLERDFNEALFVELFRAGHHHQVLDQFFNEDMQQFFNSLVAAELGKHIVARRVLVVD